MTVREFKPRRRRVAVREIFAALGWTLLVATLVSCAGLAVYSAVFFFGGGR